MPRHAADAATRRGAAYCFSATPCRLRAGRQLPLRYAATYAMLRHLLIVITPELMPC